MGYPRELLTEDEAVVRDFRPHWRVLIAPLLWLAVGIAVLVVTWTQVDEPVARWLVTAGVVIAWLPTVDLPLLRWRFTQYVLTTERLIVRQGIVARGGLEIPLENINDVRFSQSVAERLLGYGDVVIESAGEHGQSTLRDVGDPEAFQSQVYHVREERKLAFGGAAGRDAAAQLESLARLRDQGVLSAEEFDREKRRLLDRP